MEKGEGEQVTGCFSSNSLINQVLTPYVTPEFLLIIE